MSMAVMGFGNPVRSDDGVGIYAIEELKKRKKKRSVTFFDMGTSSFEVLFNLKGHKKIILIDAVINSSEPVGTIFKLPAEQINAQIQEDPLVFLHSLKWDQALSYAKKILVDDFPRDIIVYLIAIQNTKLEISLSQKAKEAADKVVNLVFKEIELFSQ